MTGRRMAEAWRRRTLVVVGHGSPSRPEGTRSVEALAENLRARRLFADVRAAFLKVPPYLTEVFGDLDDRGTYLVPHLAADGVVGEALRGALMERTNIVLCRATGTHPDVTRIAMQRLAELCSTQVLDPKRLGILVAGHGTARNPESAERAHAFAEALIAARAGIAAVAAFIEQSPSIGEWDRLLAADEIAVVPLLMAEGRHGADDVARLLGVASGAFDVSVEGPFAGPFAARGRKVWLLRPLGVDPAFADIALARVAEADA
jgi:sirohydrochlorin cobaltochelatase